MKITVMGMGLMGMPIAERLLGRGHDLTVYNRTASKAQGLIEQGAFLAANTRIAIERSECIILFLKDALAIEQTVFAEQISFVGKTVIQMGTIAPSESQQFSEHIQHLGGQYFECPVLGSKNEAATGTLILLVGATQQQFDQWEDFLKIFGPEPKLIGAVGKAAAIKLALNQLIACHAVSFSLSLGIVEKNDVDLDLYADILRQSALYAPMFDKKLNSWRKREYSHPNFPIKNLLKDVDLIIQEVKEKNLQSGAVEEVRNLVVKAVEQGLGEMDYSCIFNAVNNIEST